MGGGAVPLKSIPNSMVGSATTDPLILKTHKPSASNPNHLSLSSSSFSTTLNSLNLPVSANHHVVSPTGSSSGGFQDERASGCLYNFVFGQVPSTTEVENALAAIQSFILGLSSSGSGSHWLQTMLSLYDPRVLESPGLIRVRDALCLLQRDPFVQHDQHFISLQRMVVSLASDKAVWDAVLNNEVVQKLKQSLYRVDDEKPQDQSSSSDEPDLAMRIMRLILDLAKAKIMELIDSFVSLVNAIFHPPDNQRGVPTSEHADHLDKNLRSSVLLSIVILLVVVVSRAQMASSVVY
ncbi:hypothetical protein RJ641_017039 [Dillenia turbinata]|uniref:Uncharacterized protein n=1 Tax=Dillenia turbinata TaxID=194707 RepID=A0AAN8YZD7_9MAGN